MMSIMPVLCCSQMFRLGMGIRPATLLAGKPPPSLDVVAPNVACSASDFGCGAKETISGC
jgi:hypothetical protein